MRKLTIPVLIGLLVVGAGLAAWSLRQAPTGDAATAAKPHAGADPAVSVSVIVAERRDWPVQLATSGTVSALNTVDIRPQVASVIAKVNIAEGQFVKAGDLLFTLDSRADEANLAKAQAQLARDQAALADAERQLARSRDLLNQQFVSPARSTPTSRSSRPASGGQRRPRAAVAAARVALSYTRITAPSAGRAGAVNVYAGSYVQPSGAPLVTITQLDPIAVSFTLPQRNLPDVLASLKAGNAPVSAELPDGRASLVGRLDFVDNVVDAASGTVKVKAVFDNKQQLLWPGAYVNVQLVVRTLHAALVIPQAAIVQGLGAKTVFIVGDDGKAAQREVEVLASEGTLAAVSGLEAGMRVVVDGRQNLRPGSAVQVRATGGDAAAAAGAKAPQPPPSQARTVP